MSKHTPEPWVIWNGGDGIMMYGAREPKRGGVALMCCNELVSGRTAIANARRIVACVNACAGLPTEQLESSPLGGVLNGVAGLIAQRDELLAALEGVLAVVGDSTGVAGYHLNGDIADWDEFDEINAVYTAITKANGNTAAEVDSCSP